LTRVSQLALRTGALPPVGVLLVVVGHSRVCVCVTTVGQAPQTYGQRSISSRRAALVFALDPVYNIGMARLSYGEAMSPMTGLGATCLLTIAAVV
jgi:drug/metabolite transporter (DMT)-like permease